MTQGQGRTRHPIRVSSAAARARPRPGPPGVLNEYGFPRRPGPVSASGRRTCPERTRAPTRGVWALKYSGGSVIGLFRVAGRTVR